MTKIYAIFMSILCFTACQFIRSDKAKGSCTDIFKTTYLTINGITLEDYYTIRLSNNDTIRADSSNRSNEYTVLNDRYQDALANQSDSFHFVGLIQDSIILVEPFVFSADDCHIHYVSGKKVLNF